MKIYNSGKYVLRRKSPLIKFLHLLKDYLAGVTIARSSINSIKPSFVLSMHGNILEIGGYDDFFKQQYTGGAYFNLDIEGGDCIDFVENAENMPAILDESYEAVICISVLEHTLLPQRVICEIHRVLKSGGYLLLSCPWLFEAHMEPRDFHRFSMHYYDEFMPGFKHEFTDTTNGYFGLLAHFCQHQFFLRFSIGLIFRIIDMFSPNSQKWATQITLCFRKL